MFYKEPAINFSYQNDKKTYETDIEAIGIGYPRSCSSQKELILEDLCIKNTISRSDVVINLCLPSLHEI